ncbi:phosphatase PAP2 family protein [Pseudoxanthomonas sp. SGT-18]|uniref:phosphatase PAP2 family protein n=1 Tax=Pseudoxanthomonas sp. SGT-18 TaxID=2493087 RepID=UPI0013DDC1C8|nr:phosphatase PAP2 family protein [Pseudoxanthomonas sp. SGT-18]
MNWQWFVAPGSALYLIPLAALAGIAVMLRSPIGRRPVLIWWSAIAIACLLTAASKIAFYGWGTGIRAWDLTCFSGHTVISFAVWPVVGMLLAPPSYRMWRLVGLLAGVALAGLIAYSRIPLGAHPPSEVLAGLILGGAAAAVSIRTFRDERFPSLFVPITALVLALTITVPATHLLPVLPSERWFAHIGITLSGRPAPVNRKKWKDVIVTTYSHRLYLRG